MGILPIWQFKVSNGHHRRFRSTAHLAEAENNTAAIITFIKNPLMPIYPESQGRDVNLRNTAKHNKMA
jgi:hypothetical protein